MLCVISRQKRNFRKHRKCLKSLTLTYKKNYHHCGQGKDGSVYVISSGIGNIICLISYDALALTVQEKCSIICNLRYGSFLPHVVDLEHLEYI